VCLGVGLFHESFGRLLGMADPLGEGFERIGAAGAALAGRLGASLRVSG
jgi:hypothetical protein